MRKIFTFFSCFFFFAGSTALANASVAGDSAYVKSNPKSDHAAPAPKRVVVKRARSAKNIHRHPAYRTFTVYPGSLKMNIERLASQYGWPTVKWTAATDFNWAGLPEGTRIQANNLQDILATMLKKYPLQAQFYKGNHVLVIAPRTLK